MSDFTPIEIELKNGISKFNDGYSSIICRIREEDEESMHKLAVLKDCLNKVGIKMEAVRSDCTDLLTFKIDFDTFEKVTNRGAGRKKDYDMGKKYKECTVGELKEKLKTMKKSEIAEELGCPRMTLYRILKNMESSLSADLDTMSIWFFTS